MKKLLTSLVATAAILTLGAAGAERANAITYYGNQCADAWRYVDNVGAEACLIRNAAVAGKYITVTPGAFDYRADGHSALNAGAVEQWVNGRWTTSTSWTVVAKAGYKYSEIGTTRTVNRAAGATKLRITLTACTYESASQIRINCGSDSWVLPWS